MVIDMEKLTRDALALMLTVSLTLKPLQIEIISMIFYEQLGLS